MTERSEIVKVKLTRKQLDFIISRFNSFGQEEADWEFVMAENIVKRCQNAKK